MYILPPTRTSMDNSIHHYLNIIEQNENINIKELPNKGFNSFEIDLKR